VDLVLLVLLVVDLVLLVVDLVLLVVDEQLLWLRCRDPLKATTLHLISYQVGDIEVDCRQQHRRSRN